MSNSDLFSLHVSQRQKKAEQALGETGHDRLVIHSGKPFTYFSDDQDAPFKRTPHFAHWTPVDGPFHLLAIEPGKKPRLIRVSPRDFWYAPPSPVPAFAAEPFEIVDVATTDEAWTSLGNGASRTAFIGEAVEEAASHGIPESDVNPKALTSRLDWDRSYKTAYEVECLAAAAQICAKGFVAAERSFYGGGSERDAHHAYITTCKALEEELPYVTIVGFDDRSSTLHYQGKRGPEAAPGKVMLVDAGVTVRGYGCDITRTYTNPEADPVFVEIIRRLDLLQQDLCVAGRPGKPYLDLHLDAHRGIAEILSETGIFTVSASEAFDKGLTRPFFPHGLGHFLGIQVHDVAGRFSDREGNLNPPPKEHPYLRTTRTIEEGMVFTIEPGIYFIPMLLAPHRGAPGFNWELIDRLTPCGGIRIEDDIHVEANGNRNLTRPAF
jgi:Xaa-Pro dipeptidase